MLGIGGPGADEGAPDGQAALKLHRGISVIAFVLSAGVTGIFILEGTMVPAIVFAVITLGCAVIFFWTNARLRAGRRGLAEPTRAENATGAGSGQPEATAS